VLTGACRLAGKRCGRFDEEQGDRGNKTSVTITALRGSKGKHRMIIETESKNIVGTNENDFAATCIAAFGDMPTAYYPDNNGLATI
jgi:hypothetical protein